MTCLFILEINSVSVVSFTIIFSHSEDCLFTLFIVSFTVNSKKERKKQLISLIRSHLFIFVFICITIRSGSQKIL